MKNTWWKKSTLVKPWSWAAQNVSDEEFRRHIHVTKHNTLKIDRELVVRRILSGIGDKK